MKEMNQHILKEALMRLPQYKAPPSVLEAVFQELNNLEADDQIVWQATKLPIYEPAPMVWDRIEQELATDISQKNGRIQSLQFRRALTIAASLLVLFVAGSYFLHNNNKDTVTIAFSQEKKQLNEISMDWNEDDEEIHAVVEAFSNSILLENTLDAEELLEEMDELDAAKKEAIKMLTRYGKDAGIITQISKIERERSSIVKKMVELMLG